jgi:hypothetical protein
LGEPINADIQKAAYTTAKKENEGEDEAVIHHNCIALKSMGPLRSLLFSRISSWISTSFSDENPFYLKCRQAPSSPLL